METAERTGPVNTIGVIANPQKPRAREVVERIMRVAGEGGVRVWVDRQTAEGLCLSTPTLESRDLGRACDVVISCGGDGTILRTARLLNDRPRPILGVNLGKLGFLAEIAPEGLEEGVAQLIAAKFAVESRMMLEATIAGTDSRFVALNDISIEKNNQSRIISMEMYEAGNWVNTYVGDGLVLATPTGSTGYALSAGGPIVTPDADVIVAAPICPHSLTVRPMIFTASVSLDVRVVGATDSAILLTSDGQPTCPIESGQMVRITRGPRDTQLVRLETSSYYDILRQKLHWGLDKSLR